jgi:TIR domain
VKGFISWSGEPSRSIARALDGWLESVVQHVDAWMSDADIGSGQRWNEAISKSLDETDFGIVCVTRANQHAPWLIFEAGALAKSVNEGRVVPLCIDLKIGGGDRAALGLSRAGARQGRRKAVGLRSERSCREEDAQ